MRTRLPAVAAIAFVAMVALSAQNAPRDVDLIVTGGTVVTVDAAGRVIENGAVAIDGADIAAVDTAAAIAKQFRARETIDASGQIVLPGLINTHTHAPMVLYRGLADDLPLMEWLNNYIFPAESKTVSPEFVRAGTRLAALEMIESGTTTFADMYYFEEEIARETRSAGLRGVLGQTVIQFPVADAKTPADALARAEAFINEFKGDPLITPAVAPHAIYTTSDDTLQAARTLADRYGKPLIIHLSETKTEFDEAVQKRKKTPTAALYDLGVLQGWTLAAHAVWLDPADFGLLRAAGTGIAHCPSSNMMLASGIAPVLKMLKAGIPVGLGTDGVAGSNNDHDMMEEMDLAAKLQKVSSGDPTALPAEQAFAMATIMGAQAMGMSKLIGSLDAGKRADIISIRLDEANAQPMYNVYSQLVYSLKSSNVSDVMVNGRAIVRNRRMLTVDDKAILAKAEEYRAKVSASLSAK